MLCLSGFELYSRWVPLCKQPVRNKFQPCRTKIFTCAGTFGDIVQARVKMAQALKKNSMVRDRASSVNTLTDQI